MDIRAPCAGSQSALGNAAITGAIDGITFGYGDELGAGLSASANSLGNLVGLGNGKSFGQDYADVRDANRQAEADASHYHGGAYMGGQIAGGIGGDLLTGGAAAAPTLGRTALRAGVEAGVYGSGENNGSVEQRVLAGLENAPVGAGLGVVGHGAGALIGRGVSRATANGRSVLDAADALSRDGLQVRPLPGDVGGKLSNGLSATAEAGLVSNVPYSKGVDNYLESVAAARNRAASELAGSNAANDLQSVAGDVQGGVGGLGDYERRSAERIGQMYDDAAHLDGGAQIPTPRTRAALDALIARGEAQPGNVPGLDALRSLRDDLTPTPDRVIRPSLWDRIVNGARTTTIQGDPARYAIDSLRRLRTGFGDNFDSSQRAAREAAKELWGPLSQDIQEGLRSQKLGDAADAYRNADRAWAERQTHLDEIVNPVLGSRNQGQLGQHILNMARNDPDTLNRALALMAPDQANAVRGAIAHSLGEATAGSQNAAGDAFSLNSFLTDWNKLPDATKRTILGGQAGSDLANIATLAEAAKKAGRYKNTSGTARALNALDLIKTLGSTIAGPGGGFAAGGPLGAVGGLVGQYGLGKLMASPTVGRAMIGVGETVTPGARWLANQAARRVVPSPVFANRFTQGTAPSE